MGLCARHVSQGEGEGHVEDVDDEARDSPTLPSIPQYETLVLSSRHTFRSDIIKSQTNNLRSV